MFCFRLCSFYLFTEAITFDEDIFRPESKGRWHSCFLQTHQVCYLSVALCYSQKACRLVRKEALYWKVWSITHMFLNTCRDCSQRDVFSWMSESCAKFLTFKPTWSTSKETQPFIQTPNPFLWCCLLCLDLPRPWLLLWCTCVLQYLKKKERKIIFRMCCLIAAPFNPSCTPGDVYLVLLSSYMLKKKKIENCLTCHGFGGRDKDLWSRKQ